MSTVSQSPNGTFNWPVDLSSESGAENQRSFGWGFENPVKIKQEPNEPEVLENLTTPDVPERNSPDIDSFTAGTVTYSTLKEPQHPREVEPYEASRNQFEGNYPPQQAFDHPGGSGKEKVTEISEQTLNKEGENEQEGDPMPAVDQDENMDGNSTGQRTINLSTDFYQPDPLANAAEAEGFVSLLNGGYQDAVEGVEQINEISRILLLQNSENPENSLHVESEDEKAKFEFFQLEREFLLKKRARRATELDEINYQRAKDREQKRQKIHARRSAQIAYEVIEDDDSMFLPEDEIRINPPPTAVIPQPHLVRGYERTEPLQQEIFPQTKKRGCPPKDPNQVLDPNAKVGKAKSKKRTSKESRAAARDTAGPRLLDIDSLWNNDIVGDAATNYGQAAQPGLFKRNRQDALRELVASLPEDQRRIGRAERRHLDEACKKFFWKGRGSMYPDAQENQDGNGCWRLKGMKTSLYHYQLLGAAWMRDREMSDKKPYGGLCGDSMGLGKTIQILANIVEGQASPGVRNRTTLIVVPSSLKTQWMQEISKHVENKVLGTILFYGPGSRAVAGDPISFLSSCGVIVTTYSEVMGQFPDPKVPAHLVSEDEIAVWWKGYFEENKGVLFRVPFRRVILDEAHLIKNPNSRTSRAIRHLPGKYRWALTGTPLQNGVHEFYSYFDFLGVEHIGSFETFKKNFCTNSETAVDRLRVYLEKFMIRRVGRDRMFDRPLIALPALDHGTLEIDFTEAEKKIYELVRSRYLERIRDWVKGGAVQKQYRNILVMFLRLRQCCAHFLLAGEAIKNLLEQSDIDDIIEIIKKEGMVKGESEARFREMLERGVVERTRDERAPSSPATLCAKCESIPEDPYLTIPCNHLYCKECLHQQTHDDAAAGLAHSLCNECHKGFSRGEPYRSSKRTESVPGNDIFSLQGGIRKGSKDTEEKERDRQWLRLNIPSAKVLAVKSLIQKWLTPEERAPPKIIVFSQFRGILEILQRLCWTEGWEYCSFTGDMGHDARDGEIYEFKTLPEKRVLLASLKAGGIGLNLMAASKVIIMDPWFNQSVEDQAYSRVYRIGQKNDVEIKRLVVRESIDIELMLTLQAKKNKEIGRAIDNDNPVKFSSEELLKLFGHSQVNPETSERVIDEEEDAPFIMVNPRQEPVDSDDEHVPSTCPPAPRRD